MNEENNLIPIIFNYKSYKKLFNLKNHINILNEYGDISTKLLIIHFIKKLKYDKFIILLNKILLKINVSREYIINYTSLPFFINNNLVNKLLNIISNYTLYVKLIINNINVINIINNFIKNISDKEFNYLIKILILKKTNYINYEIMNKKIKILLNNIKLVYNIKDSDLNILLNIIFDDTLVLDNNIKKKIKDLIIKFVKNNKDTIYNYIFYYKKNIINYILKHKILIAQLIPEELKEYEDELFEDKCLNFILILMKECINNNIFAIILYNYIIYLLKIILTKHELIIN